MLACASLAEVAEGCPPNEATHIDVSPNNTDPGADQLSCWFALRVYTRQERAVVDALERKGFDCFVAEYRLYQSVFGVTRRVERVAFPGYVFARFAAREKRAVLSTAGVCKVLSVAGVPTPIPDPEIENLKRALRQGALPAARIEVGRRVKLIAGPLKGIEGELLCYAGQVLQLSVPLLCRALRVSVEPSHVKAI